jgi:hypothetical protein
MRLGRILVVVVVAALALQAGRRVAFGIPRMQAEAKALGFPATDCKYCHSFDTGHMHDRARAMGISNLNCVACHGGQLPRMGRGLFNERGQWLVDEKRRRRAKTMDMSWLAAYKESPKQSPAPPP